MKLSQYARREGITYRAAWNRFHAGKIEGAYVDDSGHIMVKDARQMIADHAVVYARVSTHKQADDLTRQADRMVEFANATGLTVVKVVTEVASGVNDTRPKLIKLLLSDDWTVLVVEHKDRLSRVGFQWFRVLLEQQGRQVLVANEAQEETSDLIEDFTSIIYSFAARLYGLRSASRRTQQVMDVLDGVDG